jgi:hypothetical protein
MPPLQACEKIADGWVFETFSPVEIQLLVDVRDFLHIFHAVQELVSAEKTPTLSIVLPLYEDLIMMLKDFSKVHPQLGHAADAAIAKLEEYLSHTRRTSIYSLAIGTSFPCL